VVYNEAVFGKNMTSVKRSTVSTPVTKLIPYGANGSTIAVVNDGKSYIVDDEANQRYNPDWQAGLYYEAAVLHQFLLVKCQLVKMQWMGIIQF